MFSKAAWLRNDIYENVSTPAVGHVADISAPRATCRGAGLTGTTPAITFVFLYSDATHTNMKGFRNNNNNYDVVGVLLLGMLLTA